MLTIAYVGGGGAKGSCLRNHFWIFFALDKMKNPQKLFKNDKKISKSCKNIFHYSILKLPKLFYPVVHIIDTMSFQFKAF